MITYLWIALGSALGGMARFGLAGAASRALGDGFPWGTLLVNVIGSFVIGFTATLTGPGGRLLAGAEARLFVMAGLCGGFTTFSAFSLQTLVLIREGEMARAGANVAASVALCLISVWLGHLAAAALNR
mgnify:CR=1 FL=1